MRVFDFPMLMVCSTNLLEIPIPITKHKFQMNRRFRDAVDSTAFQLPDFKLPDYQISLSLSSDL